MARPGPAAVWWLCLRRRELGVNRRLAAGQSVISGCYLSINHLVPFPELVCERWSVIAESQSWEIRGSEPHTESEEWNNQSVSQPLSRRYPTLEKQPETEVGDHQVGEESPTVAVQGPRSMCRAVQSNNNTRRMALIAACSPRRATTSHLA